MTELCDLAFKYGSDKCPQIKHYYTEFYYELFKDKKNVVKKVLEIGIGYPDIMDNYPGYVIGASLLMWKDFFPNAIIYGIDNNPKTIFKTNRIDTILCNQRDEHRLKNIINYIGSDIDLVIDDGSHLPEDQILTASIIVPMLDKSSIYIIEDVGNPSIIKDLERFNCTLMKFKNNKYRDDRLVVIKNE